MIPHCGISPQSSILNVGKGCGIHLAAEELARTVTEVAPVARGALLVPRQCTATVQANENELASAIARKRS
jgi:hypothetical protein